MINLELSNEEVKVLNVAVEGAITANLDYMTLDDEDLSSVSHQLYLLSRLRDEIKKQIDEGDTATNEYAPSSY